MDDTGLAATAGRRADRSKFIVRRDGSVRFDKTKLASHTWDSNFNRRDSDFRVRNRNTPRLVQKLVAELFSDPDFVAALK